MHFHLSPRASPPLLRRAAARPGRASSSVRPLPAPATSPAERVFHIEASSFEYNPGVLTVNTGDQVTIELAATDVVHGIYIDGYGLSLEADPGKTERMIFTADRPGSFRFRCSVTCGSLHPFMIGKLQVGENSLLWRRRPGAVGADRRPMVGEEVNQAPQAFRELIEPVLGRFDLARLPLVRRMLFSRWPQFLVTGLALGGFILAILSPACSAHRWAAAISGSFSSGSSGGRS